MVTSPAASFIKRAADTMNVEIAKNNSNRQKKLCEPAIDHVGGVNRISLKAPKKADRKLDPTDYNVLP